MKALKLHLVHFRSAKDLTIDLEPGLNLLVGVNGAGKSTILDGLAILFSWAAARLRSPNSSGRRILDIDIHNEKNFAYLEITCRLGNMDLGWRLNQVRKGRAADPKDPLHEVTHLSQLNEWAGEIRYRLGQATEEDLPLFVYYPVNRSVLDIPLRIKKSHEFDIFEAYDGAFTIGANFRDFFEWFRSREDLENEQYRESGAFFEDDQLRAVRNAIQSFLPEFSKISVKRSPLRMEVIKNRKQYRVDQMSDGEKCLFAMVGDLARRLAIANPLKKNPLEGEGIVLIDEIDLHLHPDWQRMVVRKLVKTFRNCQFIVSTHSPQVFGEVDAQCIRKLAIDPMNGFIATVPSQALGLDSSKILDEEMESRSRNEGVAKEIDSIFKLIDDERYDDAIAEIQKLKRRLKGGIPEIVRAESLITMLDPKAGERS